MKGMNLFCSSTASTAVTYSMYHRSKSTKSYDHDGRKTQPHVPCSSQLPINPKPYFEKHRKSSAESEIRRKSSAEVSDLYTHPSTVGSSQRYLLGDSDIGDSDTHFVDMVSESDNITVMAPSHHDDKPLVNRNNYHALRSCSTRSKDQVVVLRVSLHCRACEGKVRKHISKMEGVTSFSIDRETKKVTIIGNVTPLGVLASVSKVKNAQLWPSQSSSSSSVRLSSSPWST